ncbi:hypothetical protein RhiirA4_491276 [Rhizophagus irregularis]|uniref:Uncharacterized protein n=1 Tax=Rhizophagus irregularis TaxID=588596 RepID=A0A2I1HWB2_9GLOM|nr:hypothetical protein RhiirA4_491276 [Rhizophagus irregularis]
MDDENEKIQISQKQCSKPHKIKLSLARYFWENSVCVVRALHLGDPNIVIDLRELNLGRPEKYNIFWEYCQKFLDGAVKNSVDSLLAVDE